MLLDNIFLPAKEFIPILIRLVAAVVLGGIIGVERGGSKHDAGLRTHIIVCLGAAAVIITSELISTHYGSITDVTRMGAQVVSGIGFLGVGSIIINGNKVRGLTTAAGLWTTACVGLMVGAGFLEVAATIVLLMMFTMYVLRPLTMRIRATDMEFELTASLSECDIQTLSESLIADGYDVLSVKCSEQDAAVHIRSSTRRDKNELLLSLLKKDGVNSVSEV